MAFVDEVVRRLRGRQVVIVTSLESDGYLQEIEGELLEGGEGYLVVQQAEEESPTIVNASFIAWVYEESEDAEEE